MAKNQPEDIEPFDFQRDTNTIFLLGSAHAACVWPITHKGSGSHCYSLTAPLACLLMVVYAAAARCPILLYYQPIYLAAVLYRRIKADPRENSMFRGWFLRNNPWCQLAEPVFFLALGYVISRFDEPLGRFVMMLFLSMTTVIVIESISIARRVRMIRDGQIEMEFLAAKIKRR